MRGTEFNHGNEKIQSFIYYGIKNIKSKKKKKTQKNKTKSDKLADWFCSSLNRAKIKENIVYKTWEIFRVEEKNDCIRDYIKIILSSSRHSLCLQRNGLQNKIWMLLFIHLGLIVVHAT